MFCTEPEGRTHELQGLRLQEGKGGWQHEGLVVNIVKKIHSEQGLLFYLVQKTPISFLGFLKKLVLHG